MRPGNRGSRYTLGLPASPPSSRVQLRNGDTQRQVESWPDDRAESAMNDEIRIEVASDTGERYKALIPEFETG